MRAQKQITLLPLVVDAVLLYMYERERHSYFYGLGSFQGSFYTQSALRIGQAWFAEVIDGIMPGYTTDKQFASVDEVAEAAFFCDLPRHGTYRAIAYGQPRLAYGIIKTAPGVGAVSGGVQHFFAINPGLRFHPLHR